MRARPVGRGIGFWVGIGVWEELATLQRGSDGRCRVVELRRTEEMH